MVTETLITDILNTVDHVILHYVETAYQGIIQGNQTTITLLFTFYVMILGYRVFTHSFTSGYSFLIKHVITLLIVYGLIMNWSIYNKLVYNVFTKEPGIIAQVMVDSSGHFKQGESGADALNKIYEQGYEYSAHLLAQASPYHFQYLIYAFFVWVITMIFVGMALLLFIYAKMAMAIILALAPIFVPMLLWESTQGFFTSWIKELVNFALIPIVTSAILALMLSVMFIVLPTSLPTGGDEFHGILPFILLGLTTALLLTRVFHISAALSGGMVSLNSLASGVALASTLGKSIGKHSGMNKSGKSMGNKAQSKLKDVKNNIEAHKNASRNSIINQASDQK